jgi:hypothetical protein
MNSDEEFRCYEIKVSKSDFKSKCALSFLGDFNYFVMPKGLYEQVKNDIPKEIGVYTVSYDNRGSKRIPYATLTKRPKRNKEVNKTQLMHAMIRSLSRHETKIFCKKRNDFYERA